MLQKLRSVICAEGRALLDQYNLLQSLVKQMLISVTIAETMVSAEQLKQARLGLLQQHGFYGMEHWTQLVKSLGSPEEEVLASLSYSIRRRAFIRERFMAKAEARFLERKKDLDQVVYSLLRLENSFLARELYLQIESGESNFADLAKRYAEGPERNTNGIVGPVSLTQAHPTLVEKLQVAQPGVLLEPFRISSWWLVVRLERYAPATFNDEVSDQMCDELFDVWLCQETAEVLNQMGAEVTKPAYSNFSIS